MSDYCAAINEALARRTSGLVLTEGVAQIVTDALRPLIEAEMRARAAVRTEPENG